MADIIRHPFGEADVQDLDYASTMSATISNSLTIINIAQMTGAGTLNLVLDGEQRAGDKIVVLNESDTTARTLTFGTGFTAVALTGTISKKKSATFIYDGSSFVNVAAIQIN